jgi:hypothetical protein
MQDVLTELLICVRNCAVHQDGVGRRELRPGTTFNANATTAERLVSAGYARRLIEPAPLFADSTSTPKPPKKSRTAPKPEN